MNYFYPYTAADEAPIRVTVTRKAQLMDRSLPMKVTINGQKAGSLKNGETLTFEIPGRSAEVQAFLSMNKTAPMHLDSGEGRDKALLIESGVSDTFFILGTILVAISTLLSLFTENWIYMLIAAPPALYHLYLRFILKDKYLVIKETAQENAG